MHLIRVLSDAPLHQIKGDLFLLQRKAGLSSSTLTTPAHTMESKEKFFTVRLAAEQPLRNPKHWASLTPANKGHGFLWGFSWWMDHLPRFGGLQEPPVHPYFRLSTVPSWHHGRSGLWDLM